jgi:hypothetical protein
MTVIDKDVDTTDILDYSQDFTDIFDLGMYGEEPLITVKPIPTGTGGAGENDHATMTQEQTTSSQGGGNSITDFFAGIGKTITDGLTKTGASVQTGSEAVVTPIANFLKLAVTGVAIVGALAGAYYLLGILANAKKNIKTIKGK